VTNMPEDLPMRRVEVSFVGPAPVRQVERASGVSQVEADGTTLRCLICGSFQPFLEALRGHEVLGMLSRVEFAEDASSASCHFTASTSPGAA
jgi:hypothetical protein